MAESLAEHEFAEALRAVDAEGATEIERVEMLVEIAMHLQSKPKSAAALHRAAALYDAALARCPAAEELLRARIRARKATALTAIPEANPDHLLAARAELEGALPHLASSGAPEEAAEAELNLGLVIQSLSALGRANVTEALSAYQRALRVFDRERYPAEFAILQNNLATAFLSMPLGDERGKLREALAVQAFEEALKVVTLVDSPAEYAMLQNNLGNALQYAASGHRVQNNLRALTAYAEALKVRNARDTPLEYANTLCNKANCLRNLPDDPEAPERGNHARLLESRGLYREARELFQRFGEADKAQIVTEALSELEHELRLRPDDPSAGFGESRLQ